MLKITNLNQDKGHTVKAKKSSVASNSTVSTSMRCNSDAQIPLRKLSQEHLKANFAVNFGARVRPNTGGFHDLDPDGDDNYKTPNLPQTKQIMITKDDMDLVSALPERELNKNEHYQKTADDVVALISPNKNALLIHEQNISDELLTHKFVRNVNAGRYSKAGFEADKTDVIVMDAKRVLKTHGVLPDSLIASMGAYPDGRKKVVFVKNFDSLLLGLAAQKKNYEDFLGEGKLRDVHIVGLLSKKTYADITEPPSAPPYLPKTPFKPEDIDYLPHVKVDGLSPRATKDLLKKDARLVNGVINRHDHSNLLLTDQAIDELVDRSAVKLDGAFPNKALKALDLVIGLKLESPTHHHNGSENIITSTDVKKLFDGHGELLDSLAVKSGQFKVAENVKTRFSDVGGLDEVKEEINDKIIAYIKDPVKYQKAGRKPPKGQLLVGDPGNGKTLLARAVAGEAGVPFIAASGSEFVEKFVGMGAKRVRELFDVARTAAESSESKTAIIFIDEVDAFAKKRSDDSHTGESETEKTLNEFLNQMDGFNSKDSKVKVIVLAATNRPDILDPAFVRPGRFDDKTEVPNPAGNLKGRKEILTVHAKGKPFASAEAKAKIIDETAKFTDGMSGAELAEVFAKASDVVAKRDTDKFITHDDVVEGYLRVKAGKIKNTPSEFSEEHGVKTVRHEGGHGVGILTLNKLNHDKISFVTLEPRGNFLGAVFYHKKVQDVPNFQSVVATLAVDYLGGISEPNYHEKGHAAGVSGDLKAATDVIERAVLKAGLGVHTPQVSIEKDSPLYKVYEHEIKKDFELFSSTGQKVARMIADFHEGFLDEYTARYKANTGKGGNNLSGEEFTKLHADWLKRTGKEKKFVVLQKRIDKIIITAQNSKKSVFTIAKDSVFRTFKLAA